MIKIIVSTEQEKQELLEASKHIHYLRDLDTDIPGANFLAHLYMAPHLIKVDRNPSVKQLILIRGVPGSGKTTMAKRLGAGVNPKIRHFEADMYFTNADGKYHFQREKLNLAHSWCKDATRAAMFDPNVETIIVSNTFVKLCEMEYYVELAKQHNASLNILVATGNYQNVHGVPREVVERMRLAWQDHQSLLS